MIGWQWHQLDHMQIICTSLQTDNHASTSPLFLQAECPSCCPTNSVKALKLLYLGRHKEFWCNVIVLMISEVEFLQANAPLSPKQVSKHQRDFKVTSSSALLSGPLTADRLPPVCSRWRARSPAKDSGTACTSQRAGLQDTKWPRGIREDWWPAANRRRQRWTPAEQRRVVTALGNYDNSSSNSLWLVILHNMCWFSHQCSRAPRRAPEKNAAGEPCPRGQLRNKMPHFFIFCPLWRWPLKFELDIRNQVRFLYSAPNRQVASSCI